MAFINSYILGVGVPVLLLLSGIFYCIRLKGFCFVHPLNTVKYLLAGKRRGGVSPARALCLALAGTLGVGNMVGVASAIALGGVGAVFWMWVSALVAMVLKYAEIVLAMRHRRFDGEGRPHGAAMYYIKDLFHGKSAGRALAAVFAVLCIVNSVSMGGMIQVKAAADAMHGVFGIPPAVIGAAFAVVAAYAMFRGTRGVLSLTEKLVPFMTVGFVVLSVAAIASDIHGAARAVAAIFDNAFTVKSGLSGVGGFLLSGALRYGAMRGILSNEAGCGTAPAAHAVSDCDSPAEQGIWGIFEVFVDTILLCTLTAVVIIMSGGIEGRDYMMTTVTAYSSALGNGAGVFIAVSVVLFGLATVLCWGHYGMESLGYLTGGKCSVRLFVFAYCVSVVIGSVSSGDMIWEIADMAIGGMTLINLCVLLAMSREVSEETDALFKHKRR